MTNCECGCGGSPNTGKRFISGHNGRGRRKPPAVIVCQHCGITFEVRPYLAGRVYCSNNCRDEFRRARTGSKHPLYSRSTIDCEICGKSFTVTKSRLRRPDSKSLCSIECGRESRRRIVKGVPRTSHRSGKCAARIRDGAKCVICGFNHVTAVHHIVSIKNGGTNALENLVTLCPNHHYMAHAGLISDCELLKYATAFSFHDNIPVLASSVRGIGPSFRNDK